MASSREAVAEFSTQPRRTIRVGMADFPDNQHVPDYTGREEQTLMENLEELRRQGMKSIVHVIHRGSPTGQSVYEALPLKLRKSPFYQQLHIVAPDDMQRLLGNPFYRKKLESRQAQKVVIEPDGYIDFENTRKLGNIFTNSIGIVLGGGPGSATDRIYTPLLKQLELPLKDGVPILGVCLGHQELAHMVAQTNNLGTGIEHGVSYELGPGIDKITARGKRQAVFSRLGDAVTVMHVNHDRVDLPDRLPEGMEVLARNAAGKPSAFLIDFAAPGQAQTFQPHAEFQMKGKGPQYSDTDQIVTIGDKKVVIPRGTHVATQGLIRSFIGDPENFEALARDYRLSVKDVQDMLDPRRLVAHLGNRFFGPMMNWMADFRLHTQNA